MSSETRPEDSGLRLVWWILGTFATIILAGGSLWINSVSGQLHDFQTNIRKLEETINTQIRQMQQDTASAIAQRTDRIGDVVIKQAVTDMRMAELEKKVDRVLDILEKQRDMVLKEKR